MTYKRDRRLIANLLVTSISAKPSTLEIEEAYRKIFTEPSPPDPEPYFPVNYGEDTTYAPITADNIARMKLDLKQSAPGQHNRESVSRPSDTLVGGFVQYNALHRLCPRCTKTMSDNLNHEERQHSSNRKLATDHDLVNNTSRF